MARTTIIAAVLAGLGTLPLLSAPPAVGAISDEVGYSEGMEFSGSSYQSLVQRQLSDHSETVLALIFATPW